MKNMSNENVVLSIQSVVPTDLVSGIVTFVQGPKKMKLSGQDVITDSTTIKIQNVIAPGALATTPDPASIPPLFLSGTIISSSTKVKTENEKPILEGDETLVIAATPIIPGATPTPYPTTFTVKATSAGQLKAKAV